MEWWLALIVIVGILILFMMSGLHTAFCFFLVVLIGAHVYWGGESGFYQLILSIKTSITRFSLVPIVLFMLMGSMLFQSGLATLMINTLNKLVGRVPGRLSLLSILAGTLFASLSGSNMASVGVLGSVLTPEMEKYGYKKSMSLGPIMGGGLLAMMIPPSGLGVFVAVMAGISVSKFLISTIIPGLMMALFFIIYILIRCWINPDLAPTYEVKNIPSKEKLKEIIIYILPLGIIVFLVTGIIVAGIATPSEAAATGCLGTFILAIFYRRFTWKALKNSTRTAVRLSAMILIIMASSSAFSQILTFSGASSGLIEFVADMKIPGIFAIIGVELLLAIMGCFMHTTGLLMIVLPLFTPIVTALHLDPIWFAAVTLLNVEIASITPPFGTILFVLKGVSPEGTTLSDVISAAIPFILLSVLVLILMFVFPELTTWLPGIVFK